MDSGSELSTPSRYLLLQLTPAAIEVETCPNKRFDLEPFTQFPSPSNQAFRSWSTPLSRSASGSRRTNTLNDVIRVNPLVWLDVYGQPVVRWGKGDHR